MMPMIPAQARIEDRCPLAMIEPMKGEPVWAEVTVPELKKPAPPKNLLATAEPGKVTFQWDAGRPGQYRYKIGDAEPIFANQTAILDDAGRETTLTVRTVGRQGVESEPVSITGKPLPVDRTPVFVLTEAFEQGKLQGHAAFKDGVLDLAQGGYLEFPYDENRKISGQFSVELRVKFDSVAEMPILVSNGTWNQSGWFLQKFGGGFRFHFGGVDCDGGVAETGKWTTLLGTYDGRKLHLYQDGRLVGERACRGITAWTGPMLLGQYNGGIAPSFQVKGQIRDVRIYRCVMPPRNP